MPSNLTAFSVKQWLLQRLFTALAVLRTSQSHLETKESLCPFHWQPSCKLASSVCMKKFLFRKQLQKSFCNQYRRSKRSGRRALAKALSVPRWKDGKNILSSKERHDNFQLQAFQCVILRLSPNEAEARISYVVAYFHGRRLVSWVWLCSTKHW